MSTEARRYRKDWDPVRHYQSREVAENYDRERFSGFSGRIYNALEKRLIRRAFAGVPKGAVIADVPCGTGRLAEVLLEAGYRVVGVDISQPMLDVACRRLGRFGDAFRTEQAEARSLAARQGEGYDAVLCARLLMHFPPADQIAILRGVARTTHGPVVFTHGLDTRYHRLRRRLKRLLHHPEPAAFPLTIADLERLLRAAGLRLIARHAVLRAVSEAIVVVSETATGGRRR